MREGKDKRGGNFVILANFLSNVFPIGGYTYLRGKQIKEKNKSQTVYHILHSFRSHILFFRSRLDRYSSPTKTLESQICSITHYHHQYPSTEFHSIMMILRLRVSYEGFQFDCFRSKEQGSGTSCRGRANRY